MKPEPTHPAPSSLPEEPHAWLSALADGEASAADRACAAWREDPEARSRWHAYQLIGDVMRSEDLARPAVRDAAFLAAVRERLAQEPVLLAPEPLPAQPAATVRKRQGWLLPAAAVAGFVVVAGVLVVARVGQPGVEAGPGFATAPTGVVPVSAGVRGAAGLTAPAALPAPSGETLLRDERLDEYLRAHQFARGGAAISAPSTAVRRVELTVPATPER